MGRHSWQQGSWGQHGAHLGSTGPRWAPCWPHELFYLGLLYPVIYFRVSLIIYAFKYINLTLHFVLISITILWKSTTRYDNMDILCIMDHSCWLHVFPNQRFTWWFGIAIKDLHDLRSSEGCHRAWLFEHLWWPIKAYSSLRRCIIQIKISLTYSRVAIHHTIANDLYKPMVQLWNFMIQIYNELHIFQTLIAIIKFSSVYLIMIEINELVSIKSKYHEKLHVGAMHQ